MTKTFLKVAYDIKSGYSIHVLWGSEVSGVIGNAENQDVKEPQKIDYYFIQESSVSVFRYQGSDLPGFWFFLSLFHILILS